ncbi:hypothetical protein DPMN_090215 [Dreissena polymorpha]|uniref:Uncharacterized protein n=1 Tax=Dreissena polymorpha TaxID=45954 RepID=A0A9D4KXB2_DREPO|nr:hypothetical protein DPMN_090215 [Dreissena polymorpha]
MRTIIFRLKNPTHPYFFTQSDRPHFRKVSDWIEILQKQYKDPKITSSTARCSWETWVEGRPKDHRKLVADYPCHSAEVARSHYKHGFAKTSIDALAVLDAIKEDHGVNGKGNRVSVTVVQRLPIVYLGRWRQHQLMRRLSLNRRYHRPRPRHRKPSFQDHRRRRKT